MLDDPVQNVTLAEPDRYAFRHALTADAGSEDVAVLDVVSSPSFEGSLQVNGELTVGRKSEAGVHGIGDRYMSSRHARLHVERGGLYAELFAMQAAGYR